MKSKFLIYILLLSIIISFYGCYNDFLIISSDFSTPVSKDSNAIFFFHTIKASQPPKGISRFPDGGTHKTVYKNTSIYKFDIKKNKLDKIFDFGNLPYDSWNSYISVFDDKIIFSIVPGLGWEWRIYNSTIKEKLAELKNEIGGIYLHNLTTLENNKIIKDGCHPVFSPNGRNILYLTNDTLNTQLMLFNIADNNNTQLLETPLTKKMSNLFWLNEKEIYFEINEKNILIDMNGNISDTTDLRSYHKNPNKIKISELKDLLKNYDSQDWGFSLKKYWSKDIDDFCNDIVLLNGNLEYRKTILEEYKDDLSRSDIEDMLKDIEKRKQNLEQYKKAEYEYFSQETIELLNSLLNKK